MNANPAPMRLLVRSYGKKAVSEPFIPMGQSIQSARDYEALVRTLREHHRPTPGAVILIVATEMDDTTPNQPDLI